MLSSQLCILGSQVIYLLLQSNSTNRRNIEWDWWRNVTTAIHHREMASHQWMSIRVLIENVGKVWSIQLYLCSSPSNPAANFHLAKCIWYQNEGIWDDSRGDNTID